MFVSGVCKCRFLRWHWSNSLSLNLVVKTKTLAAILYQVPNQPLHFSGDKLHSSRSEDDIIVLCLLKRTCSVHLRSSVFCILINAKMCSISTDTWAHFFEDTRRTEWPAHIPMTKATIRGLDTVQAYASNQLKLQVILLYFHMRKHT